MTRRHLHSSALLGVLLAMGAMSHGLPEIPVRERDERPRKFTDARIAAAEAKRKAKAENRLKGRK